MSYGKEVTTSLVEGSVLNSAGNESIQLKPGYQSFYTPLIVFKEERFESERVLSWMDGIYYFYNASLENIF